MRKPTSKNVHICRPSARVFCSSCGRRRQCHQRRARFQQASHQDAYRNLFCVCTAFRTRLQLLHITLQKCWQFSPYSAPCSHGAAQWLTPCRDLSIKRDCTELGHYDPSDDESMIISTSSATRSSHGHVMHALCVLHDHDPMA